MKKNLTKLMALIMALALVLAFAACSKDPAETDTSTDPSTEAVSETETDTAPVDNTDPSGEPDSTDAPGPVDLVKPNDAAAGIKMYNDAVGKIGSVSGSVERKMVSGDAAGLLNLMNDEGVQKEFNKTVPIDNAKLVALDAGSVSAFSATEQGDNFVLKFTLNNTSGDFNLKHGTGGFMYFIDANEAVSLVKGIAESLMGGPNDDIKVSTDGVKKLELTNGVFEVTVNKTTGKISKAVLTFDEHLQASLKYKILPATAKVDGHGVATFTVK